jgi:DNA-binding response OmpR family regulator
MPGPKKILVIEDDPQVRAMVGAALAGAGYQVFQSDSVRVGLEEFRSREPDLLLLDVNLPDGSGFDVCRSVRGSKDRGTTPIIMLTARQGIEDKSEGFGAGADQYLVKPVLPQELLLWCEALLRRLEYDAGEGGVLKAGELAIDPEHHVVRYGGDAVLHLTVKEFELLYFLVKNRRKTLTRKNILARLWHTIRVDNVVDVHISNLRRKLPPDAAAKIQTVPGRGYMFFG